MNRLLQILNFLGVLLLATLCTLQWFAARDMHAKLTARDLLITDQSHRLDTQQKTIHDQLADLNDFRARITLAESNLQTAQSKLDALTVSDAALKTDRDQLQKGYDNLKAATDRWLAAVQERDDALKKANALAQQLATERNDGVQKYNHLADQYNDDDAELKKAADTIQSLLTQRNDLVKKYNDLAAKYNALVSASSSSQPG